MLLIVKLTANWLLVQPQFRQQAGRDLFGTIGLRPRRLRFVAEGFERVDEVARQKSASRQLFGPCMDR